MALAPRLAASGYGAVDLTHMTFVDWEGLEDQGPAAAVLLADKSLRITMLYQKLEAGDEGRLLHTVRGREYCLCSLVAEG